MAVIRLCAAAAMRRRWRTLVMAVLVLGVLGGGSLAAFAGARRTASAYPRFLEAGHPSDLSINNFSVEGSDPADVDAFPEVERIRTWYAFHVVRLNPDGGLQDVASGAEFAGSLDGQYFTQDRVGIIDGRLADPAAVSEVVVNDYARDLDGLEVGQTFHVGVFTDDQLESETFFEDPPPPFDELDLTIVGVALFPDEVVQDESDRIPRVLLTPAFTNRELEAASYTWHNVVLADGDADVAAVQAQFVELLPEGSGAVFRVHSADVARAQRAVRPLALTLAIFGAVAAVAALALVGQGLVRQVRTETDNDGILRALGADSIMLWAMAALLAVVPILAGSALAIVVAIGVSPFAPIGPVRQVETNPGLVADWAVLGIGALAFVAVLSAITAVAILTQARAEAQVARPSRIVSAASARGLGPAALMGMRLALEPGRGRSAVPVRSVMAGAALAVGALTTALCFAASLDALVDTPRLYGWGWDATALDTAGYGAIGLDAAGDLLDDPRVAAWTPAYFGSDELDGRNVPLIGVDPAAGISPPILAGRTIAEAGEVVVGPATLEALGKEVGDEVELAAGGGEPTTVSIVGTATFPTVGQTHGNHPSLGVGAMLVPEHVPGALGDGPAAPALFVRWADGTDPFEAEEWLREGTLMIGEFPGSTQITRAYRPAEIVNSDDLGGAPALLAGALGVAALASLTVALSVSTSRRRRDLALLKALGFTRREVSTAVAWQASITVIIGLLVGVPLGLVSGRWLWHLFARQIYVVPSAQVPAVGLIAMALSALVLCNLVAAGPGRAAGRTPPATTLHTE